MKTLLGCSMLMLVVQSLAVAEDDPWVLSANNRPQAEELLPAPVLDRQFPRDRFTIPALLHGGSD